METVPREVTKVDYYAIEYLRQYIPQVIPETTVETIPVERIVQRTEYIPVERKIVHYPETPLAVEYQNKINQGISIGNVGRVVSTGTAITTTPVVTGTTYVQPSTTYVSGPISGSAVIGGQTYVSGGQVLGGTTTYVTGGSTIGGPTLVNPASTTYVAAPATEYVTYETTYPGTTTSETVTYETVGNVGTTYGTVGGTTLVGGTRYI